MSRSRLRTEWSSIPNPLPDVFRDVHRLQTPQAYTGLFHHDLLSCKYILALVWGVDRHIASVSGIPATRCHHALLWRGFTDGSCGTDFNLRFQTFSHPNDSMINEIKSSCCPSHGSTCWGIQDMFCPKYRRSSLDSVECVSRYIPVPTTQISNRLLSASTFERCCQLNVSFVN